MNPPRPTARLPVPLRPCGRQVILIEGRRKVPKAVLTQLRATGAWLARALPRAVFRSGNAEGSDTQFARGVASVDPSRMQYVLPSPNMGRTRRHPASPSYALASLSQSDLQRLCDLTAAASPGSRRLAAAACGQIPRPSLAAKGRYLLRDTLKVVGAANLGLAPATFGLFYVDLEDPEAGGTGHTIRVCRRQGIPVVFQDQFLKWLPESQA